MAKIRLYAAVVFLVTSANLFGQTCWNWSPGNPILVNAMLPASQNIKSCSGSSINFEVRIIDYELLNCISGPQTGTQIRHENVTSNYEFVFSSNSNLALFNGQQTITLGTTAGTLTPNVFNTQQNTNYLVNIIPSAQANLTIDPSWTGTNNIVITVTLMT